MARERAHLLQSSTQQSSSYGGTGKAVPLVMPNQFILFRAGIQNDLFVKIIHFLDYESLFNLLKTNKNKLYNSIKLPANCMTLSRTHRLKILRHCIQEVDYQFARLIEENPRAIALYNMAESEIKQTGQPSMQLAILVNQETEEKLIPRRKLSRNICHLLAFFVALIAFGMVSVATFFICNLITDEEFRNAKNLFIGILLLLTGFLIAIPAGILLGKYNNHDIHAIRHIMRHEDFKSNLIHTTANKKFLRFSYLQSRFTLFESARNLHALMQNDTNQNNLSAPKKTMVTVCTAFPNNSHLVELNIEKEKILK